MSNMSPCLEVLTPLTLAHALELSAWQATHQPVQLQCQQHRRCGFRRQAATRAQGVLVDRDRNPCVEQRLVFRRRRAADRPAVSGCASRAQLLEDVVAAFDQLRALLDQR